MDTRFPGRQCAWPARNLQPPILRLASAVAASTGSRAWWKPAAASLLVFWLLTGIGLGRDRNPAREREIEAQLAAVAPGLVETFRKATAATDQGDAKTAVALFDQILETVPNFDPALRRLGYSLNLLGQREKGMAMLELALSHERSTANLVGLASSLANPPGIQASTLDKQRALQLVQEASKKEEDRDAWLLRASLTLELGLQEEFRQVLAHCQARYPGEMETHYLAAIQAAVDSDWLRAEDEIKRAEQLGLPSAAVQNFLAGGVHDHARMWRITFCCLYILGAWALGLVLIYVAGKALSVITLNALNRADPNELNRGLGQSFKRAYRALINAAGFYYYLSLPVLIFLLIALAGSIFYAFLLIGQIPIKLMLILAIVTLVTIFQMIRTLFIKPQMEDPGRPLKPEETPGLWTLARRVAAEVETRPVDEIRLTPGTELAVYERGNYRERMRDQARRVLILGVAVLDGFKQPAFSAVMAHEYGHFAHRDTAGGDAALRVNSDLMKFAMAMIQQGVAVWWNIAFHFLRLYHLLFRRISHGASRLQEVRADIVAVNHYGAGAFEEGLRHAIGRSVEFGRVAARIDSGEEFRNPSHLRALFEPNPSLVPQDEQTADRKLQEIIHRPSSPDDTHPSPADRFALARRIQAPVRTEDHGLVWDLFADKPALLQEMVKLLADRIGLAEAPPAA